MAPALLGFIAHMYRVAYFFANPLAARATLLVASLDNHPDHREERSA